MSEPRASRALRARFTVWAWANQDLFQTDRLTPDLVNRFCVMIESEVTATEHRSAETKAALRDLCERFRDASPENARMLAEEEAKLNASDGAAVNHVDERLSRETALDLVCKERDRQDAKWGQANLLNLRDGLVVLMEEVGEAAKASLEGDDTHACTELVQVAAVAVAIIERHGSGRQPTPGDAREHKATEGESANSLLLSRQKGR